MVFRELCKLSMKSVPQEASSDLMLLRGKTVALDLLKILFENVGVVLEFVVLF